MTFHILLVSANERETKWYRSFLESQGWHVSEADNAERALTLLRGSEIHAAIIDRALPDSDGLDLVASLRADPVLRSTVILFLIAPNTSDAEMFRIFSLAPDATLTKPVNAREVVAFLTRVLQHWKTADSVANQQEISESKRNT